MVLSIYYARKKLFENCSCDVIRVYSLKYLLHLCFLNYLNLCDFLIFNYYAGEYNIINISYIMISNVKVCSMLQYDS